VRNSTTKTVDEAVAEVESALMSKLDDFRGADGPPAGALQCRERGRVSRRAQGFRVLPQECKYEVTWPAASVSDTRFPAASQLRRDTAVTEVVATP
jgi:hypothetical protein